MSMTVVLAESVQRQQAAELAQFNRVQDALAQRAEAAPAKAATRRARRHGAPHLRHGARVAH